jgi:hypothetical protein
MKTVKWILRFLNALVLTLMYGLGKLERMFKPKQRRKVYMTFTQRLRLMSELKNKGVSIKYN